MVSVFLTSRQAQDLRTCVELDRANGYVYFGEQSHRLTRLERLGLLVKLPGRGPICRVTNAGRRLDASLRLEKKEVSSVVC